MLPVFGRPRSGPKPPLNSRGTGTKPAPAPYFSIFVERTVMAPDIPKIDPDRHPDLGASAWYFRDKVLRGIFHGQ
jgi:hypothetical protein